MSTLTPEQYFEAIKDLRDPDQIKTLCKQLIEQWEHLAPKTKANKLTPYNALVKTIPSEALVIGENAFIQRKADGTDWLRHLHFKFASLTPQQWTEINSGDSKLQRLQHGTPINPTAYLEVASKLLLSSDPHQLAVGLIAVTGRRPIEMLARGKFTAESEALDYLKPGYQIHFSGQAKKRDYDMPESEKASFTISTLVPAQFVLEAFNRLRKMPESKDLLQVIKSYGDDYRKANDEIHSRRNKSLNRVVKEYFNPVLPARYGEDEDACKTLRAAYLTLATERDRLRHINALLFASRLAGHFIDTDEVSDTDLGHLLTTLGYFDYYVEGKVEFAPAPEKSKGEEVKQVRAFASDYELVKQLQDRWDLQNQQAVLKVLIEKSDRVDALEQKLLKSQAQIKELEVKIMNQVEAPQPAAQPNEELGDVVKRLVAEALKELLPSAQLQTQIQVQPQPQAQPKSQAQSSKPEKDWEGVPSEELRQTKERGAAEEKCRRAYVAITAYNDAQPEFNNKWAIGVRSIQDLAGVNHAVASRWVGQYGMPINDHNVKHGLGQFHNQRHGKNGIKIGDVISW